MTMHAINRLSASLAVVLVSFASPSFAQSQSPETPAANAPAAAPLSPEEEAILKKAEAAASAEEGDKAAAGQEDTFETYNRFMSSFNGMLRTMVINPVTDVYQAVVPEPVQKAVSNAASNAMEPVTAVSSLVQGDTQNAGNATKRFLVNTTVGLGGTMDQATDMGISDRKMDPGLAAGAQGVDPGAHIVLPVIGPSNMRDAPGDIGMGLIPGVGVAKAVDNAATYSENQDAINAISEGSLDPYTAEKEAYEQHRAKLVQDAIAAKKAEEARLAQEAQQTQQVQQVQPSAGTAATPSQYQAPQ